jgi:hypothetical protein
MPYIKDHDRRSRIDETARELVLAIPPQEELIYTRLEWLKDIIFVVLQFAYGYGCGHPETSRAAHRNKKIKELQRMAASMFCACVDDDCGRQIGNYNYAICRIVLHWLPEYYHYDDLSQASCAMQALLRCFKEEPMRVLNDAIAEYRRCLVVPYEEKQRKANGDVWDRTTP